MAKVKLLGVFAGQMAPDFEAETLDGAKIKLSDYRGKVVLIDFWATWCAPCVAELPNVKKAYARFAGDGFVVLSVSFDKEAATAKSYAARQGMSWPQIWAEKADKGPLAERYAVGGIPATFLIGPDGKLVGKDLRGEKLIETVRTEIRKLKAPPTVEEGQPEKADGAKAGKADDAGPM